MFHSLKRTRSGYCCVFSTHRHQASTTVKHTLSVCPCPFVILMTKESSELSQASRQTYTCIANTRYQVHTCVRGILMHVASVGCFPRAWRRGSWHFQVTSLHQVLRSIMDLLFVRFTLFFLPEQASRSGRRMPPAERSDLYTLQFSRNILRAKRHL